MADLNEGAGFNDGTLVIHVNGPDGLAITRGYMEGCRCSGAERAADGHAAYVDLSNAVRAGGPGGARGRIAQVTEINGAFKIVLMDGRRLDDLELALLPVLPVESVRVQRPATSGTC
jgi:hypothetical protein